MNPIVIIPAYNPDEKLLFLVQNLRRMDLPVVVINDGSRSESSPIFESIKSRFQIDIINHPYNMGKGAALKTGFRYVFENYPEACGYVTADADGQHGPEDILKVARALERNPNHFILGSRIIDAKNVPWKSMMGNRITSLVFRLSTGKRCSDTQTGLRGIPRRITHECLSIPGNRFEYEMNQLLGIARSNIPIKSVPVTSIYLDGNKTSHFSPIKDSIRIYLNILKFSLSSIISAITDLSLFTMLVLIFGRGSSQIFVATTVARLTSGGVNFMINKRWVFQSKNPTAKEALKYLTLFSCQMLASWVFVTSLKDLPIPITFVKILVDVVLFFISYQIQKRFIFVNSKKGAPTGDERISVKTP